MSVTDILDDLFHNAALLAFVAEARAVQGWPALERVKGHAYRLYEEHMAGDHDG